MMGWSIRADALNAMIVAGLAGFVALVWIVRLLGQVFEAWQVG